MARHIEIVRESEQPRGLFVTLEGGEGSGKSSQAQALKALLEGMGYRVALTHEPAGCELGRRVQALLNDSSIDLDPRAELFLFEAARAQHLAEVILPALASHDVVICDRFSDSTVAYQGHGRGLSLAGLAGSFSSLEGDKQAPRLFRLPDDLYMSGHEPYSRPPRPPGRIRTRRWGSWPRLREVRL